MCATRSGWTGVAGVKCLMRSGCMLTTGDVAGTAGEVFAFWSNWAGCDRRGLVDDGPVGGCWPGDGGRLMSAPGIRESGLEGGTGMEEILDEFLPPRPRGPCGISGAAAGCVEFRRP